MAGFPAVVGCIDGTHINIQAPSNFESDYVNRKQRHSINVQAVCDHTGRFTNIVARWPGSTHDSHIFRTSNLCVYLETSFRSIEDGLLLMTPFLRPPMDCEERYNTAHRRTRNLIERVFGRWKHRFLCLRSEIRFQPEKYAVILACAIFHNIALDIQEPDVEDEQQAPEDVPERVVEGEDGRGVRRRIADTFF